MAVVAVKEKQIKKEITCPNCENLLSYKKEDVKIGYLGWETIICPECGEKNLITDERIMPPTFPQTFFRFGSAAKVSDGGIQEMINKAVSNIKISKPGDFYNIATGDTMVIALKYEGGVDIIVAKDYWEDSLTDED